MIDFNSISSAKLYIFEIQIMNNFEYNISERRIVKTGALDQS